MGVNEGVNIPSRGQISPLGAKFTPHLHKPWCCGIVVIAYAYRIEDPGFKSRQGVTFLHCSAVVKT
jgi:hypothetical protein